MNYIIACYSTRPFDVNRTQENVVSVPANGAYTVLVVHHLAIVEFL
jgi:hypothetical protein